MKTYVVYGAAHDGFGIRTARLLLEEGNSIIGLFDPTEHKNAQALIREYKKRIKMIPVNILDYDSLRHVVNQIDEELDGFVNAAFSYDIEDVNAFDYALSERLFRANYHAPMFMSIELKKKMRKGASIVIVTSIESDRGSFGGISYAASKAAMHNLIKSLACNWGKKDQIRVNAVATGWIGGEMESNGPFEVSMNITPLGRLGRADEVANTISFLLSEKASFINAQVIYVDGGYLAVDDIAKCEFEFLQH